MQPIDATPQSDHVEYLRDEETVNAALHGLGFVLSLLGTAAIMATWQGGGVGRAIACGIYPVTLVLVYAVSTLSHAVQRPRAKHVLRTWDQGAIYLLIVGNYTPFAWAYMPTRFIGWFLAAIWGAALLGLFSKVVVRYRVHDTFSSLSYVALGWLPALPLIRSVPANCLIWMAVGGVSYTVGTLFLKLDDRYRYFHAAWHVFVIVGSACHYYGVFAYAVQR